MYKIYQHRFGANGEFFVVLTHKLEACSTVSSLKHADEPATPRPALLVCGVIFEDLDADVVRPFDESEFEFAAE